MDAGRRPAWLEALDAEKFFASCSLHESSKKNEKNICCLDCCTSICPHCVPPHRSHRLLQVRRYVYHDVVRLEDLERLIDCSNVQSYTINSSKVIFIKKRAQSRQFKGSGNICTSCDRSLQDPYIHCSLGCKVDFVLGQLKQDLSPYLRPCKSLQLGADFFIPHDVDGGGDDDANETTHSTVVEGEYEQMGSTDSDENLSVPCADFIRKRRSGVYVSLRSAATVRVSDEDSAAANMSRRKGIPQRSPLC